MDTTPIAGTDGMCSCRITVGGLTNNQLYFVVSVEKILSSGCVNDNLEFVLLSNQRSESLNGTYEFTCNNNRIDSTPAQELRNVTHYGEDVLWLLVTRKENSPIINGTLEIKSRLKDNQIGTPFTLECYEPNTNVSTEFTRPTTPPSSSTKRSTTQATTINFLTDLSICRSGLVPDTEIIVNMDTSRISESDGTCSCRITLSPAFLWVSVGDIYSTNCKDGDPLFKLQTDDKTNMCTCQDGRINDSCTQELSKEKRKDNDIMWLIVTKNSPKLSGRIKITSKDASGIPGLPYTVECYEPNTNTSTTPSVPITSTMTVNPPEEGSASSLSPQTSSVTIQTSTPTSLSESDSSPSTKVSSSTTTLPLPESTEQSQTTTKKLSTGPTVAVSSSSASSTLTSPPSQPPPSSSSSSSLSSSYSSSSQSSSSSSSPPPPPPPPPSSSSSSSSSSATTSTTYLQKNNQELPVAALAGGVAGGSVLVIIVIIVVLVVVCRRRKNKGEHNKENKDLSTKKKQCYENKVYDTGDTNTPLPDQYNHTDGGDKPQPTASSHVLHINTDYMSSENCVYESAGIPKNKTPPTGEKPVDVAEMSLVSETIPDEVLSKRGQKDVDHGRSADHLSVENGAEQTGKECRIKHEASPSGDIYAAVEKKMQVDQKVLISSEQSSGNVNT